MGVLYGSHFCRDGHVMFASQNTGNKNPHLGNPGGGATKKPTAFMQVGLKFNGGPSGTRTPDLGIKSPLLYQLS